MKEKNLYIIAGCNGAGKTTASGKHELIAQKTIDGKLTVIDDRKFNELKSRL
jgi:predicted ABC-type ATPase